ncbi:Metallophosphoesterase [Candidatus Sulfopaludibacter sp. SbA3]|nr:Metallophosphoesterase [Candidatus Sulfopaludibacter sp. SbA3]
MANTFDIALSIIFFFTQFRITRLLLGAAHKRLAGPALRATRAAIALFDLLLFAGYVLSFSDLAARLRVPGRLASVVGACALVYLMIATGVLALHTAVQYIRKRFEPSLDPGRRRLLNAAGNAVLAAPFAVLGYGYVRRTDFRVREIDVPIPDLPHDLDGLRILQLSDIHLSAFLGEADLARVVDAAVETRPHLAVITGDLISARGDPLDACIRQLARVKADAGVFGCMGNHERYARVEAYTEQAAARVGIRFLRGHAEPLRFGDSLLNLAGVDHQSKAGGKRYLVGAEKLVQPGAVNILLSHNPDVFPVAAAQGYNLMLAGHTHGGQVTVEILDQAINPARFFTPYVYGLYRAGGAAAYVTRGIGTIGIPARIGAPPEISVLRLRKA